MEKKLFSSWPKYYRKKWFFVRRTWLSSNESDRISSHRFYFLWFRQMNLILNKMKKRRRRRFEIKKFWFSKVFVNWFCAHTRIQDTQMMMEVLVMASHTTRTLDKEETHTHRVDTFDRFWNAFNGRFRARNKQLCKNQWKDWYFQTNFLKWLIDQLDQISLSPIKNLAKSIKFMTNWSIFV